MSEMCNGCVLKDRKNGDVLFAVAAVKTINLKHANGFNWIEEAESLQNHPISITALHELGGTALLARDYSKEELAPAEQCAASRLDGSCPKP